MNASIVKECGLTWDEVRSLNMYEKLLICGYEEKVEVKPMSEDYMPKGQKKRKRVPIAQAPVSKKR